MMMRKLLIAVGVGLSWMLVVLPAIAATPAFQLDVEARVNAIVVTVTFEPVPSGFAWTEFEQSGVPERLVGLLPADAVDDGGRPLQTAVFTPAPLGRIAEGVYRAEVSVAAGRWAVVPWPAEPGFDPQANPGVPPTVFVTVTTSTPPNTWLPLTAAGFLAVLAAAVWFGRRHRTR